MGIKGLTRYVRLEEDKVLKPFKLHHTRLVIDGDNIVFLLWENYEVDYEYGGDFDVYAEKCGNFIDMLRTCNVDPYVVFDGGHALDGRKSDTILDRKKQRIQNVENMFEEGRKAIVPILAKKTLMNVLVEKDIPQVTCEFEADREIAVLANRFQCPVMSFDSDFYVFDLKEGYIPFNYVKLATDIEFKDGSVFEYVPVKLYKREAFTNYLAPGVFPVLACILGNDYVDGQKKLRNFYTQNSIKLYVGLRYPEDFRRRIKDILSWLRQQENIASCINNVLQFVDKSDREPFKRVLQETIDEYCNLRHFEGLDLEEFFANYGSDINQDRQANVQEIASSTSGTSATPVLLPSWFRIAKSQCNISPHLQDVALLRVVYKDCQVEVLAERSIYGCSKSIREITYAIILGQGSKVAVSEYDRKERQIKCFKVKPCRDLPGITSFPHLDDVPSRSCEEMFRLLLASLKLPHNLLNDSMSEFSKYLIGLVTYWIRNSKPMVNKTHCYSVLFGVIVLHARFFRNNESLALGSFPKDFVSAFRTSTIDQVDDIIEKTDKYFENPQEFQGHKRDKYIVHAFAQFKVCLKESLELNEVVMMPLTPPCPSLILNNSFLYNFYRDLQKNRHQKRVMNDMLGKGSPVNMLFRALLKCADGVMKTFEDSAEGELPYAPIQREVSQQPQRQTVPVFKSSNRYNALSNCS